MSCAMGSCGCLEAHEPEAEGDSALDMLRDRMDELHDQRHAEARKADSARQGQLRMAATALDALTILRGCRDIYPMEWDALMRGPMGPSFATVWDKLKVIHEGGL